MDNFHPPLAYSFKEACRITSIGRTRMYELAKTNQITVIKIGRRTLIDAESLKRLVTAQ